MLYEPEIHEDVKSYIEKRMKGIEKILPKNQPLINRYIRHQYWSGRLYNIVGIYSDILDNRVNDARQALSENTRILQVTFNGRMYIYLRKSENEEYSKEGPYKWKRVMSPGQEIKSVTF
jgi:hypothetical protein